jgi:hypothetical protein
MRKSLAPVALILAAIVGIVGYRLYITRQEMGDAKCSQLFEDARMKTQDIRNDLDLVAYPTDVHDMALHVQGWSGRLRAAQEAFNSFKISGNGACVALNWRPSDERRGGFSLTSGDGLNSEHLLVERVNEVNALLDKFLSSPSSQLLSDTQRKEFSSLRLTTQ